MITANENFLRLMGYSLDEIRGRHHSMFVDKKVAESREYQQFWDKLRRGEFDSGEYPRIDKNGRELWLNASYNPVLDGKGKPYKVIKFASDITASKRRIAETDSLLGALSRTQAVIEFSPEGMVLTANDNFLKTMGYTLEEIKGHHHGMFVDPEYRNSRDYQRFWESLGRGELEAGQLKRIAKDGREIWLQATYNPVLDQSGKLSKVVKYASDITLEYTTRRREAEMNAAFKGALDNLLSSVMVADADLNIIYLNNAVQALLKTAEADIRKELTGFDANRLLGANIDVFHKNPAHQRKMLAGLTKTVTSQFVLGGRTLQVIAGPMVDSTGKRLGTVVEWADRTAELSVEREVQEIVSAVNAGDLEKRVSLEGKKGFYENLASGINNLADNMSEIVGRVKTAAGEVTRGAEEISQGNSNLSQRTEEQASSLEQTASSMEEMTSTVKQNADNAAQANQLVRGGAGAGREGRRGGRPRGGGDGGNQRCLQEDRRHHRRHRRDRLPDQPAGAERRGRSRARRRAGPRLRRRGHRGAQPRRAQRRGSQGNQEPDPGQRRQGRGRLDARVAVRPDARADRQRGEEGQRHHRGNRGGSGRSSPRASTR